MQIFKAVIYLSGDTYTILPGEGTPDGLVGREFEAVDAPEAAVAGTYEVWVSYELRYDDRVLLSMCFPDELVSIESIQDAENVAAEQNNRPAEKILGQYAGFLRKRFDEHGKVVDPDWSNRGA